MSSRVQQRHQSSAFTSTRLGSTDRHRHSLVRQKKVLPRDDSGIFSLTPSPLTPSRGTFPPTVPAAEPGAMSSYDHVVCRDVDEGPPGRVHDPVKGAGSQSNFVNGRVMQVSLRTCQC